VTDIGVWNFATAEPERTAVIEPGGRAVSYAELAGRADQYGRGLQALGLRPGDAVAGMLPNSTEALALLFAAMQTGLYVVPVNWHLAAAEVAYILGDSGAEAFVAHERFAQVAADAADQAGIASGARFAVGDIPGFTPLAGLGADGAGRPSPRTAGAPMVYTSGTSGRPKGVRRALTGEDPDQPPRASTWFFGIFSLAPFDGNVHLCCSPLYHTAVLNFATISLQLGHPVVLMDRFDAEDLLALVERHRVTHTHMVPTQFRRLLALPNDVRDRYDVSSMRAAIHSAAPCPPEVKRQMLDWWGPVVTEYYAASEGGGTVITGPQWLARPGSVGLPWPGPLQAPQDHRLPPRAAPRPQRQALQAPPPRPLLGRPRPRHLSPFPPARTRHDPQRSRNCGRRFSAKARGPSRASSLANTAMPALASSANASFSAMPSVSRMTRRIARTATGPLAAIIPAIESARSSAWPSGTTCPTSPIESASGAVMCRPVSSRSAATVYGIWRTSRTADPPSGNSPQRASETPNRALWAATLMSHACRISVPPAMAGPSTAAISGLVRRRPLSSGSITDTSSSPSRAPGWSDVIALRSAPAQNAPPAPVSTQTRMSGSLSVMSQACCISAIIGPLSALRACGRFIVTISTCPRRSMSACGAASLVSIAASIAGIPSLGRP